MAAGAPEGPRDTLPALPAFGGGWLHGTPDVVLELPTYTLVWRFINSYATVIVGSLLFWNWIKRGLVGREEAVIADGPGP